MVYVQKSRYLPLHMQYYDTEWLPQSYTMAYVQNTKVMPMQ